MRIRINRKFFLFTVVAIFILATSALLSILSIIFSPNADFKCNIYKVVSGGSDECGFIQTMSGTTHLVTGIITGKEQNGDEYILHFATGDKNGKRYNDKVLLPPDSMQVAITRKKLNANRDAVLVTENSLHRSKDIFSLIDNGEEVALHILTPTEGLGEVKNKFGDLKFITCYSYNHKLINFLKNSSTLSRFSLMKDKLLTGCNVSVLQVILYQ